VIRKKEERREESIKDVMSSQKMRSELVALLKEREEEGRGRELRSN